MLLELGRLAPTNDELWSLVGELAFESGDASTARDAFRRVLELRGPHFESLVHLGAVASELGLDAEAEEALEAARRIAPESFLPPFVLGAAASATVSMLKSREGRAMVRGLLGSLFKGR